MSAVTAEAKKLTRKDFVSDQDVRWCPGCGDYAIIAQVQKVLPELGIPRENIVFVSGIGCSSRFPYYMNTYGFHGIHGRAPAIASGLKVARPDLSVWIITGDGDALSIGGNHFLHVLRRNFDVNILLFNNEIYGLTKGQYSPTSPLGQVTKSSPLGVVDNPVVPPAVALGSAATFVARAVDVDQKNLQAVIRRAVEHRGASLIEVLQNCVIFNDGAFEAVTAGDARLDHELYLEHGKPMIFGPEGARKGLRLGKDMRAEVVSLDEVDESEILVHDETNDAIAFMLANLAWQPRYHEAGRFPVPLGVLHAVDKPVYEDLVYDQIEQATEQRGSGDFDKLFASGDTWVVD
ncbi:MAG: 2-oxoacid:ferredoxin oxidoreductase subunit beta [Deltaproteobacteria bacterium]|nr:MAG: 2-oxoacid:ferredoxin oxidoreductase subunit beta [Deltaproteobacteria bacterium]